MGRVSIFTGTGHGKTPAALGEALMRASRGEHVVIIQFLKGKGVEDSEYLSRLEPEIKIFHFEKSDNSYEDLSSKEKSGELANIKNGINFARKVISTGECDLLILDEILGLVDYGIISEEELCGLLDSRSDSMDVIMTGIKLSDSIKKISDEISTIS